ncbi:hypothetical protein V1291_005302 [Nitrobacteraceae bacterium AZCC 1564]
MTNVNGIHYEFSKPVRNEKDGYYYQRFRQVDAGSCYDEGPEKDLGATLGDVHRFYEDIQSLQQSTTDQTGILKDLLKSVEETEGRIKTAIEKNDPRDSIQIPLDNAPGSNDIIIDELDENGRLPLGKYIPITLRTNDGISSAYNPQALWDNQRAASTYQPSLAVPSLEDFRAFQTLTEPGPATFNERGAAVQRSDAIVDLR